MLSWLQRLLFNPKLRSVAALQQFLAAEAAHLAQRSVIDFVRNELRTLSGPAFADPKFQALLAIPRWDAFVATLADMTVLAHARLAEGPIPQPTLDARLGDLYATILAAHPPAANRPAGWDSDIAALRARLAARGGSAVRPQAVAEATASRIFPSLPLKPRDPVGDRAVFCNAFAFGLIAFNDRLRRLLVVDAVCDELTAGQRQ